MINKHAFSVFLGKTFPGYFSKSLKNPVFIVGSGRSGTTMLTALLGAHQSIAAYPDEANVLWHPALYPYHKKNADVSPIWLSPKVFTQKSISLWPNNWGQKIRGIFGAYQALMHKPVLMNKTVMANFMLKEMLEIFPDAKFIYVVRNGLSVALSYQKKEKEKYAHPRYNRFKDIVSDLKQIRLKHAEYWNETVQQVEKDKQKLFSSHNFYELRYESLVDNPNYEIEKLLQFVNLPMGTTGKFNEIINSINNRNYKAKEELDEQEATALKNVMRKGLALKGY